MTSEGSMTRKQMAVWVIAGVGLLGATMLQAERAGTPAKPLPDKPAAANLAPGPVAAEGRVVTYPGAEVVVGAERTGRLVRILVEEGRLVAKGALLAELESDELRASLSEAQARLAEADAEIRLAESNLKRRRGLAEQEIIAAHDLDQANRDLEIAIARRDTALATVTRYAAQLEKTRIVAPITGTVILRHVDAGETLETGAKIATLADLRRLRIEAEADEADAAQLTPGAPVTITAESYPGRAWKGSVEDVPDSVTLRRLKPQDPARPTDTRILAVKVAFAEATPLKLGTTVELQITPTRR